MPNVAGSQGLASFPGGLSVQSASYAVDGWRYSPWYCASSQVVTDPHLSVDLGETLPIALVRISAPHNGSGKSGFKITMKVKIQKYFFLFKFGTNRGTKLILMVLFPLEILPAPQIDDIFTKQANLYSPFYLLNMKKCAQLGHPPLSTK